ncbi:hypothetical protein DPEC_G00222290 [Dallia pectoralis]|uniref:Uncharacterized protein n=1 Tax=Dallia pectoralis TaxID=75939 RepID=A0ACC2FZX5_DALPE|nr:hypothetical protein DPEC_G00222290 [Dallia pectoralis]
MIDLSYLTEIEQEIILSVLKRDAKLKKSEEQRVKNLQKKVHDKGRLKYLTGEWFYETKSRRHRDKIHGSDIIRASIRQKKPVTILELSQLWSESPSFVNSENKDVYVPPELSGLLEETIAQSKHYYREDSDNLPKESQDMLNVVSRSSKERQNPFNSTQLSSATLAETDWQLTNEGIESIKTPDRDQHEQCHAQSPNSQLSDLHSAQLESGHEEDLSLIRVEMKQTPSRPLSRSMEDILSPPKSSAIPSSSFLSVPEQMKMLRKPVSSSQNKKDNRDSDSTSVNSLIFGWNKRTGSSLTNLSVSSGMASMSSVSDSMASIYSGLEGDVEVKGTIQFAINYVQKLEEFQIFVVHCRDLAVAEPKKNRSDPYAKCYLLPDKEKAGKRKTSVKKKTLNPTYNEILRFKVTMETLKTQNLDVSVWHNNNFGRNSFLGKVDLDLSDWDFSDTQMNDYALKERMKTQSINHSPIRSINHRGEMKIALRFMPQVSHNKKSTKTETGEVQVWVKDCKNLLAVRDMVIDPFVKCTVLPETSRKSCQKTRVVKKTVNPMFNHTMVYDGFRPDDLREACVEVTVWDHDKITNHFLGGLRIGLGKGNCYESLVDWMDSTIEEANLWERMMKSPNEWIRKIITRFVSTPVGSLRDVIRAKSRLQWESSFCSRYPVKMITRRKSRSDTDVEVHTSNSSFEVEVTDFVDIRGNFTTSPSEEMSSENGDGTVGLELDDLFGIDTLNWTFEKDAASPLFNIGLGDMTDQDFGIGRSRTPSPDGMSASQKRKWRNDPSGRMNNKNAIAARMNRLKKKEYVNGLEKKVGALSSENRTLKQENGQLNKRVEELEDETRGPTVMVTTIMPCPGNV